MFDGPGLAVSIPINELAAHPPAGSLYDWQHLAEAQISDDLRAAATLIERTCRARHVALTFIARPEIFTNSASLDWLHRHLPGVEDHLCISDGSTIRIVPDMRNHVFLYRQGIQTNADGLLRLMRRAPELIATMQGQVNTAYGVQLHRQRVAPPTVVIANDAAAAPAATRLYPFYLTRHSAQQSAAVSLGAGPLGIGHLARFRHLTYVPLTEVAARDRAFADMLAALLLQACFNPARGVVLRLPWLAARSDAVAERMAAALAGLCVTQVGVPRVIADNVVYTTDDADPEWLAATDAAWELVAHESFDFWRHTVDSYRACRTITVYAAARRRPDRHGIGAVLRRLLGRDPELRWLPRDDMQQP